MTKSFEKLIKKLKSLLLKLIKKFDKYLKDNFSSWNKFKKFLIKLTKTTTFGIKTVFVLFAIIIFLPSIASFLFVEKECKMLIYSDLQIMFVKLDRKMKKTLDPKMYLFFLYGIGIVSKIINKLNLPKDVENSLNSLLNLIKYSVTGLEINKAINEPIHKQIDSLLGESSSSKIFDTLILGILSYIGVKYNELIINSYKNSCFGDSYEEYKRAVVAQQTA